jgi:hypothetical protein
MLVGIKRYGGVTTADTKIEYREILNCLRKKIKLAKRLDAQKACANAIPKLFPNVSK